MLQNDLQLFQASNCQKNDKLEWVQQLEPSLFDLRSLDVKTIPKNILDENFIRNNYVLPLCKTDATLYVACVNLNDRLIFNEIAFKTGLEIIPILVEKTALDSTLLAFFKENDQSVLGDVSWVTEKKFAYENYLSSQNLFRELKSDENSVIAFVNKILSDAVEKKVSDIHFEPFEQVFLIRFRQDGVLRVVGIGGVEHVSSLSTRLKIMAGLDISERRLPQDGRISFGETLGKKIDFRVSTCPGLFGEKIVLRVLDGNRLSHDIHELGFEPDQKNIFLNALKKTEGLILVTGPTGSGKTNTLYAAIKQLNTEEKNILTIEDPVEIALAGITQVNINLKAGLEFSTALKAFLRQDPDVMMVGEIRDMETAKIAVMAAHTGHLVLSTLHTNSASETITRLLNLGALPFNVASSLQLIVAERLVRKLCLNCRRPIEVPSETLLKLGFKAEVLENLNLYQAVGCALCHQGYRDRTGIFEVLPLCEKMRELILKSGTALELAALAKSQNILSLKEAGLKKVREGITSLEEINRVLGF